MSLARIDDQLAVLGKLSPEDLRERWKSDHGQEPPPGFGPDLLMRSIAYRLQEKGAGGLSARIRRLIRQHMLELATSTIQPDRVTLRSGTSFAREWHGQTHHVLVVEGRFQYRDRVYRSLTAIAREITGAAWSGPRFFGLKGARVTLDRA